MLGFLRRPPIWLLVSLAWIGPAILAAFQGYAQANLRRAGLFKWSELIWQGADWLLYGFLTPAVFWLARRFPLVRSHLGARISIHVLASIVLCAAWASGGLFLGSLIAPGFAPPTRIGLLAWFFTSLPFGVAVYFALLAVEHATFYFVAAREREAQAARLSEQLADARLAALRMQMQPHFVFNTLNAIAVVIRDGKTDVAQGMLERLSKMLRRVLRADRPREVTLGEELDFVDEYLGIETVRFADRLRVRLEIDPEVVRAGVPELLVQPLVENALRHGVSQRTETTEIVIAAFQEGEDLVLRVTDQGAGPGTSGVGDGSRVGLANTRQRLAALYGDRAEILLERMGEGGTSATIRLPYHVLEKTS